jgi:hypothetical protein
MWNEPSWDILEKLPKLYETEKIPVKDKIIHMHFFIFGTDWYVAEYDPKEKIFWGFVILNEDYQNAEWGYFALEELQGIRYGGIEIDRDLFWQPRTAAEVDKIAKAQNGRW